MKVRVDGQHRDRRGGHCLVAVAVAHQRPEAILALRGADEHDPQRVGVRHRRRPLGELGDRLQLLVGDGLIAERVGGTRGCEQQLLRGGLEGE